jgi:GNAT superfamily N-acetyltransferase
MIRGPITAEEFTGLRQSVGWGCPSPEVAATGLRNSLFFIRAEQDGQLIGGGRLIGDGSFTFYVQDIVVRPEYQGQGVGRTIMAEIMAYVRDTYPPGAMVGLMAAKGKEGFYRKFGFIERPNDIYGPGMIRFIR